jgi:hypothetical protein
MNVSTLAYCKLFIFENIVARNINATGKNFLILDDSNASHSILPMIAKAFTTMAVPINCENRMKEGAGTLYMAYLLDINSVAEQIIYPPTAKGVVA